MARIDWSAARPLTVLAGDGAVFTAGMIALVGGVTLALATVLHTPAAGVGAGVLVAVTCGPFAAWNLHGRAAGGSSAIGAVLGCMIAFLLLFPVLVVGGGLGHAVAAIASLAGASLSWGVGAGVVGVTAAVLLLAAAVWLDVDALHDLASARRAHPWLDVARLLATAGYAVYVVGTVLLVAFAPGPPEDQGNAGMMTILLLVMPVVFGAAAVTGAEFMTRDADKRPQSRLIPGGRV